MAELGVVGLVLVLGFLGFAIVSGARRGPTRSRGAALGAALAVFTAGVGLGGDRLDLGAARLLRLGRAGRGAARRARHPRVRGRPRRRAPGGRRRRGRALAPAPRFGLGIATLLVGWAAIWAGGDPLPRPRPGSATAARRRAPGTSRPPRKTRATRSRSSRGPPGPRLQLALVEELDGDLEAAKRDLGEAIERAPDNWQLWFVRTRLEVKAGQRRRGPPRAGARASAQPAGSVPVPVIGRWAQAADASGRERWILPYSAGLALAAWAWSGWPPRCRGSIGDGSWSRSRPISMLLPCGILILRGRLDGFEPLACSRSCS